AVEVAFDNAGYHRFFSSLNTQEEGVRVQSIRAAIQKRHMAGDRLLGLAVKMAIREVHRVAKGDDLAQEVRAVAEALENPRDLRPARMGAVFVVDLCDLTRSVGVFNQFDLALDLCFYDRHAWLLTLTPRIKVRRIRKFPGCFRWPLILPCSAR